MNNRRIYKQFLSLTLLVLLVTPMGFASTPDDEKTEEEKIAELKTNAKDLVRETSAMALALRSPTNRINFTIRSADILWNLEETDARAMFNASTEDVKRLMAQIDVETNQQDQARNTSLSRRKSSGNLRSKTSQVFAMRSSLVSSLANHDPEWAMRFVQETSQIFTNRKLTARIKRDNKRLETTIIRKIADKDVTKALELGREKLSRGLSSDVLSLMSRIYAKDKEKGADFAKDILSKLNTTTIKKSNTWLVVSLFQYGLGSIDSEETPLLDRSSMGTLGELIAKYVTDSKSRYRTLSKNIMTGLEKYSPGSAAQIKRTFDQRNAARNARRGNRNSNSTSGSSREKQKQLWAERNKFQSEIANDLNSLGNESLTEEDRQQIVETIKNKILSIDDDNYRFNGLIRLAMRVAGVNDNEAATNILNEAESYIKQDPKERKDFSNNRSLADAYALVDTDRSFAILENMIYRLNGVVNGYIQYMEFSGNGRVVENDELIINNRSRQFTNNLKLSSESLRKLAENDYIRLKDLTDKFERSEMRVEVRLQLAKSLLNSAIPRDSKKSKRNTKNVASVENLQFRKSQLESEFELMVDALDQSDSR